MTFSITVNVHDQQMNMKNYQSNNKEDIFKEKGFI
jgi:hypothetical protein